MSENTSPKPWERQPGETPRAFGAFLLYRNLPPHERSLSRVAEMLASNSQKQRRPQVILRQVKRWSAQYGWVERAAAWDEEKDRQDREMQAEARRKMHERHASAGRALILLGMKRLEDLQHRVHELSPLAAMKFIVAGVQIEREAMGLQAEQGLPPVIQRLVQVLAEARREYAEGGDEGGAQAEDNATGEATE